MSYLLLLPLTVPAYHSMPDILPSSLNISFSFIQIDTNFSLLAHLCLFLLRRDWICFNGAFVITTSPKFITFVFADEVSLNRYRHYLCFNRFVVSGFHLSLYPQWPHSLTEKRPGLSSEERADSLELRPKAALGRLVSHLPAWPCQLNRLGMLCPSDDFLFARHLHCKNKQANNRLWDGPSEKC